MKQAILLLTNRTDYAVHGKYDKLVREYGEIADVFLLFDRSSFAEAPELEHFKKVYTFSVKELLADGYTALEEGFLGNCQYPLLKFRKDYPQYDFYWRIEDDVVFTGDWDVLFDAFSNDTSDLISAKIRTYADDPNWYWWDSVKEPQGVKLSSEEMYASFTPVFRLSAKALDCLEVEMRKGWRGHFEALVPIVMARYGLVMRDMGGDGRFVNNGDVNRFYTNDTHTWPIMRLQPMKPNTIYHPIKEKISQRTDKRNCLLSIVGKNSCHKEWIAGNVDRNYDIHLIVYDHSFETHYDCADFAYGMKGRKADLLIDYFNSRKQLLSQYDHFFIIDEKCPMKPTQINDLFDEMAKKKKLFYYVGKKMFCFSGKINWLMLLLLKVLRTWLSLRDSLHNK